MGEKTAIAWCDHTFNPWWGCVKVSAACTNCYAATFSNRLGYSDSGTKGHSLWGPSGRRRFFGHDKWRDPQRWDRKAERDGVRRRVFCGSMCDLFEALPEGHPDRDAVEDARWLVWEQINLTPHLDWLLLTKRPENVPEAVPTGWMGSAWPKNAWLGVSAGTQAEADDRIPLLLQVPAAVRFVSYEPSLGPVDLRPWMPIHATDEHDECATWCPACGPTAPRPRIDWLIIGGESGPRARPCDVSWIRSLVRQCREAGVPAFVKQLGAKQAQVPPCLLDRAGADPSEWPYDLRVREWPR